MDRSKDSGVVEDQSDRAATLRSWLTAVGEIAREANSATSLAALLTRIADTACSLMACEFCAVLLIDPSHRRLVVEAAHGLTADYVARYNAERPVQVGPGPLGEGPSSLAFRTGRAVSVADISTVPIFGPWNGVPFEAPYRAVLSVPLRTQTGTIGVLNCYTADPHDFSSEETALLETLADQAAIAIEAARLRARERAQIADLERQRMLLERAEEIHRDLTRAILDNAGLGGIAEALMGLLDTQVSIEDAARRVLASSSRGAASPPPRQIEALDSVSQISEVRAADGQSYWLASILIGRELAGRLIVGPVVGAPGPLERRALEHGSTVAALELLKQRTAQEVEWRLRGDLLDDLLAESLPDEASLRSRAAHLGNELAVPQAVLVVRFDPPPLRAGNQLSLPDEPSPRLLAIVNGTIPHSVQPHPLVAGRRDHVVVLWPLGAGQHLHDLVTVANRIRQEARSGRRGGSSVSVAIGPIADRLSDISGAYRAACKGLDLTQMAGGRDRLVSLDQLNVYGLLLQVERPNALLQFAHVLLAPLQEYDRRRGSELVRTLRTYMAHECRPGETAAALVVHPHTLAYRLRRIETLLGVSLHAPGSLLRVQLALMVQDVVGDGSETPPTLD